MSDDERTKEVDGWALFLENADIETLEKAAERGKIINGVCGGFLESKFETIEGICSDVKDVNKALDKKKNGIKI